MQKKLTCASVKLASVLTLVKQGFIRPFVCICLSVRLRGTLFLAHIRFTACGSKMALALLFTLLSFVSSEFDMPRIFALVSLSTNTIEYTSESYSKVSAMWKSLPGSLRDLFKVVRYDANPDYL